MKGPEQFTSWEEERLWVLRSIDDLQDEQRRQAAAAAVSRESVEKKLLKDVQVAHDRIRDLQTNGVAISVKNWVLTGVLSVAAAVAFELLKGWLAK